jgi:hypothetical protein
MGQAQPRTEQEPDMGPHFAFGQKKRKQNNMFLWNLAGF